jgi:hypothetical protein
MHTDEDRKWPNQRDPMQRNYCKLQRPIMAYPPYHSNHTFPPAPVYPMWGQPGSQTAGVPIWPPPGYPLWQQPAESWHWKPYPAVIFLFGIKPGYWFSFHILCLFMPS